MNDIIKQATKGRIKASRNSLHVKPDVYPKVDDDAAIVLTYAKAAGVIHASWNWPYSQ
jgi:hypothetical protein